MISKIPFVLQAVDASRDSLAFLNFRLIARKHVIKQLDEIQKGMEDLLGIAVGADRALEKLNRLEVMRKYQTEASNILTIRAEFLEKISDSICISHALSKMSYDDWNIEEIEKVLLDC